MSDFVFAMKTMFKRRTRKRHLETYVREAEVRILLSGTPTVDSRAGYLDQGDPWDDSHHFTTVANADYEFETILGSLNDSKKIREPKANGMQDYIR